MFWQSVLNGTAGHTYGANGIWQVNTRAKPYGPSPHGTAWGSTAWEDAYLLPGSFQVGLGRKLLERYRWWKFEPHPEWVAPHWTRDNYLLPSAGGIPGEVRVIFCPQADDKPVVKGLEKGTTYSASLFDPVTGADWPIGTVRPDANGDWQIAMQQKPLNPFPLFQDWVVVLEAEGARRT